MTTAELWQAIKDVGNWLVHSSEAAGTLGALISLKFVKGNAASIFAALGSGLGMAFFVGPYLMEVMGVTSEKGLMAGGFLVGITGAVLVARIIGAAQAIDIKRELTGLLQAVLERLKR